jgi:hypothetical protein
LRPGPSVLLHGLNRPLDGAAPFIIGVEPEVQADGAPSSPMGLSMPHTKPMWELGGFSVMSSPADTGSLSAARIMALRLALDKPYGSQLGRILEQKRKKR